MLPVRLLSAALLVACARPAAPTATRAPDRALAAEPQPSACVGAAPLAASSGARDIDGRPLSPCPSRHLTGFARDGYCVGGPDDPGVHAVCAQVTDAFLSFSRTQGNDLVTPRGSFPGLRAGDGWCLCASRWREADEAGVAPPVVRAATGAAALDSIPRASLDRRSIEGPL